MTDDQIAAMWKAGRNAEEIAAANGTTESRAIHDINRVLNERAPHHAAAKEQTEFKF